MAFCDVVTVLYPLEPHIQIMLQSSAIPKGSLLFSIFNIDWRGTELG